jgi:DNA-directed RNA polymerase subunit delta
MGCPHEMRPDMSVTDIAYCILKSRGKPIHFKELIQEVMQVKAMNQANSGRLIAQMHTEINLDSRFVHQGNGEWGLREWQPKQSKVVKIRPEPAAPPSGRSRTLLRDDEDEEDLFDEAEEDEFESDELDDEFELDGEDEFEDELDVEDEDEEEENLP